MAITIDATHHAEPKPPNDAWPNMQPVEAASGVPPEEANGVGDEKMPSDQAAWLAKVAKARTGLTQTEWLAEKIKTQLAAVRKSARRQKKALLELMSEHDPSDTIWTQPAEQD